MKEFSSTEMRLPYQVMQDLRQSGKLVLGMDEDGAVALQMQGLVPEGHERSSHQNTSIISGGLMIGSIVASFLWAWWVFIPGCAVAMVLYQRKRGSNAADLVRLALHDEAFYNVASQAGFIRYRVLDPEVLPQVAGSSSIV